MSDAFSGVAEREVGGHCPVAGCYCAAGSGFPAWGTDASLRDHVDAHFLGSIVGEVPNEWLRARGLVRCRVCGNTASASRRGGVHERCAATLRAEARSAVGGDEWAHVDDGWERGGWAAALRRLPVIAEIFSVKVFT